MRLDVTIALALSLAGNLYLGVRLISNRSAFSKSGPAPVEGVRERPNIVSRDLPPQPNFDNRDSSQPPFRWEQVQSGDIATYASNLRRAGFPEQAIQDALIPVLEESYTAVLLENARFSLGPRWAEPEETVQRASRIAIDEAEKAYRQQLKGIFGLEEYRVEGYKPWNFRVSQEDLPWLEDSLRARLLDLKKHRSTVRQSLVQQGYQGKELEMAMQPFIEKQEEELRTFVPQPALEQLLSKSAAR